MADLSYSGGGYVPPPTGATGDTSGGGSTVDWFDGYNTTQGYVAAADPVFNNEFFSHKCLLPIKILMRHSSKKKKAKW